MPETAEKANKAGGHGRGGGYTPRPWRCQCGAELGQVVRPGEVRRLEVWTRPRTEEMVGDSKVVVVMTGHGEVRCQCCDAVRAWDVGADAMAEMLRRRG